MALVYENDGAVPTGAGLEALAGPSAAVASHLPSGKLTLRKADRDEIVVMIGDAEIPAMMVHVLAQAFGPITVIQEDKQPSSTMIKRRLKLLGPIQAGGQLAFGILLKFLHKRAAHRKSEIIRQNMLSTEWPASVTVHEVGSVNDDTCREILSAAKPKVIVLVGTRMVGKATLECVDAPFINYHAGLNPTYRGMNGGYWALAKGDTAGAGVTVHLVDAGVDTGDALYWCRFAPTPEDSFVTYPLLQAAVGRDLLVASVRDALDGTLSPQDVPLSSRQWFHPTAWNYLWTGVTKDVW